MSRQTLRCSLVGHVRIGSFENGGCGFLFSLSVSMPDDDHHHNSNNSIGQVLKVSPRLQQLIEVLLGAQQAQATMPVGNRPKRLCQSLAEARGATTQVSAFGGHTSEQARGQVCGLACCNRLHSTYTMAPAWSNSHICSPCCSTRS